MSQEMAPFFLGPMPPQEFLSTFLLSTQPQALSFKADMFDVMLPLNVSLDLGS